ncbi:ATP-binding protein, partial [Clostridium perfringens]|nr:ATP-binding protein [Clostridium perfringens]
HILKGDIESLKLSKFLSIPYKYTVCTKNFEKVIEDKVNGEVLPIELYMDIPWE